MRLTPCLFVCCQLLKLSQTNVLIKVINETVGSVAQQLSGYHTKRSGCVMLRVAAIQLRTCHSRQSTLSRATALVKTAADAGARLVCLPEAFTGVYGVDHFGRNAEVASDRPCLPCDLCLLTLFTQALSSICPHASDVDRIDH
jgi:hypothetical protein